MKIRHLSIEGFLSYQEKVEIDFTQFELACITGENGSGKSSILDAVTWALFGKARQVNESLINLQSDEAVVSLSFEYAGESYKIKRSNKRGKPARLTLKTPEVDLTERTTRDTQNKIEQILKIDYETFIHAVFFLQGESDQFVSASSGQRKQVLFDILGLDAWEKFRLSAAAKIKSIEKKMEQAQGSVQVLEEDIKRLPEIELDLKYANSELPVYEKNLETAQAALDEGQKKKDEWKAWKDELADLTNKRQIANGKCNDIKVRLQSLVDQQQANAEIICRKDQITKDYARAKELDQLLEDFRIKELEQGKLQHTLSGLETELQGIEDRLLQIPDLEKNIAGWKEQAEKNDDHKSLLDAERDIQLSIEADLRHLSNNRDALVKQFRELEGREVCPLCEQKLNDPDSLLKKLTQSRGNLATEVGRLKEKRDKSIETVEATRLKMSPGDEKQLAASQALIEPIQKAHEEFDLDDLRNAEEAIALLGYDKVAGMELRNEADLVSIINAPRDRGLLEGAEKAGDSLEIQVKGLQQDLSDAELAVGEYHKLIESKEGKYPDDYSADDQKLGLLSLARDDAKIQLQAKTQRVGELNQILKTIGEQQAKLKEIKEKEKDNTALHQKYSTLQEAFSKKGVPALLVEQSLPQIESKANQLLHRLSGGQMAVHFITQKAYSDSGREDMKETLDIEIQDQAGIRDYEMYSGGESFRINFAIRMALSNVLANRAGAKLRTLVIDEGFGSQDAGGRDRLINAINTVKEEYDKVLVITHIPEVIESFPVQLRVEKTAAGSQVRIL